MRVSGKIVYEQNAKGRWTTVPHGTYSRYTNGGCRCDECREANRIACWLRRNGQGPGRRPLGHNVMRYLKGCRCDTCKAAKSYWTHRNYVNRLIRRAGTSPAASSLTGAASRDA